MEMKERNEREISLKKYKIAKNVLLIIFIIEVVVTLFLWRVRIEEEENRSRAFQSLQEEIEVEEYNQTFTSYSGNIRGTHAKTLCNKIAQHNRNAENNTELVMLKEGTVGKDIEEIIDDIDLSLTTSKHITEIKNKIESGAIYNITIAYSSNTGHVTTVAIEKIAEEKENVVEGGDTNEI